MPGDNRLSTPSMVEDQLILAVHNGNLHFVAYTLHLWSGYIIPGINNALLQAITKENSAIVAMFLAKVGFFAGVDPEYNSNAHVKMALRIHNNEIVMLLIQHVNPDSLIVLDEWMRSQINAITESQPDMYHRVQIFSKNVELWAQSWGNDTLPLAAKNDVPEEKHTTQRNIFLRQKELATIEKSKKSSIKVKGRSLSEPPPTMSRVSRFQLNTTPSLRP
jgi:hypothetical protein